MGRGEMKAPEPKTAGARIIEGLEQAIAWTKGENDRVRVTLVDVPEDHARGTPCAAGRNRKAPRGG